MKKFRFCAICFAAITAVSLMCSCGGKTAKDDDDDEKTERVGKKVSKAAADEAEVAVSQTGSSADFEDFDAAMGYLESNASSFFPTFNRLMQPVRTAFQTNVEPSVSDAEQLEAFVNANQEYFEAIGAIIGHEQVGGLSSDQQTRLESFSNRYSDGLENIGILIGIGGMAVE